MLAPDDFFPKKSQSPKIINILRPRYYNYCPEILNNKDRVADSQQNSIFFFRSNQAGKR